jgi:hypothetical protein
MGLISLPSLALALDRGRINGLPGSSGGHPTSGLPTIQELSRAAARIDTLSASASTSGASFVHVQNFRVADMRQARDVPYGLGRQALALSESERL